MKQQVTFRVYKLHGTKCIRKFDNLDDAKSWVNIREDWYRVDWVIPVGINPWGNVYEPEQKYSWNNKPLWAY